MFRLKRACCKTWRSSGGNDRFLSPLSEAEFARRLRKEKRLVLRISGRGLDRAIGAKSGRKTAFRQKRLRAYDAACWYVAEVKTSEIGVWRGAGGLPVSWTKGSVAETGRMVKRALKNKDPRLVARAGSVIPGALRIASLIAKEKYLYPIILPGSWGRRGLRKLKGGIDDGGMRSIAFAVSGRKKIKAYVGILPHSKK